MSEGAWPVQAFQTVHAFRGAEPLTPGTPNHWPTCWWNQGHCSMRLLSSKQLCFLSYFYIAGFNLSLSDRHRLEGRRGETGGTDTGREGRRGGPKQAKHSYTFVSFYWFSRALNTMYREGRQGPAWQQLARGGALTQASQCCLMAWLLYEHEETRWKSHKWNLGEPQENLVV